MYICTFRHYCRANAFPSLCTFLMFEFFHVLCTRGYSYCNCRHEILIDHFFPLALHIRFLPSLSRNFRVSHLNTNGLKYVKHRVSYFSSTRFFRSLVARMLVFYIRCWSLFSFSILLMKYLFFRKNQSQLRGCKFEASVKRAKCCDRCTCEGNRCKWYAWNVFHHSLHTLCIFALFLEFFFHFIKWIQRNFTDKNTIPITLAAFDVCSVHIQSNIPTQNELQFFFCRNTVTVCGSVATIWHYFT